MCVLKSRSGLILSKPGLKIAGPKILPRPSLELFIKIKAIPFSGFFQGGAGPGTLIAGLN